MSRPIAHLLTHTVTVEPRTGVDSNGDPTFGSPVSVAARVEAADEIVVNQDGNEERARHRIMSIVEIGRDARLTLTGDVGKRRPLTVRQASTPDGGLTLYETLL